MTRLTIYLHLCNPLIVLGLASCDIFHRQTTTSSLSYTAPISSAETGAPESDDYLIGNDDPILVGLNLPDGEGQLVANRGPHQRYSPQSGKISFVKKHQKSADGGYFDPDDLVAAHKKLPLGAIVRCTRLDTDQSVIVLIKDRGPYIRGRIIDLSRAAAHKIGLDEEGVVRGRIEVLAYPRETN